MVKPARRPVVRRPGHGPQAELGGHRRPDLTLHLYGKSDARPGRKMGHYTVLGDAVAPLRERAEACRAALAPESATPAAQVQRAA